MNYLVTGGAGFIGSHLVDRLLKDGHKVTVIDNFSTGKKENLKLPAIERDVCENLDDIFQSGNFDAVFHLAALPLVQLSIEQPQKTNHISVDGTINLLETIIEFGVERFVFTSSSAAYGDQEILPIAETALPQPSSPYGIQKLSAEHYCRFYAKVHGIKAVSLRLFSVYGPRQSPNGSYGVVARFISQVKSGETLKIFGDGKQTRDFVFVADVVDALLAAANTENAKCFGEVFNIGTSTKTSINRLAELITYGMQAKIDHAPALVEQRDTQADIAKAKKILKWKPAVALAEGLKKTNI